MSGMDKLFAAVVLIAICSAVVAGLLTMVFSRLESHEAIKAGLVQKVVLIPGTLPARTETIWTKPDQPATVENIK